MIQFNRSWLRRGSPRIWMLGLLALNLAWRTLRYVQCWPMWGDEGFVAVNFGLRDWVGMTRPLEHLQIVPVGFLWLTLGLVKLAGLGEMVLRLIPYLAGVGGAVLVWRMARRWLGANAGLAAMAIFAASYYPVRHAAEVKPYSMDLLVAAAILHVAACLYARMPRGRERSACRALWWVLFGLFAAAVWVSYTAAFVGGGVVLVLAWRAMRLRRPASLGLVLAAGIVLTVSFVGMYLLAGRPQSIAAPGMWNDEAWRDAYPPLDQPWRIPIWVIAKHAGNMFAYPNGGNHWGSTGTLLLVIAGSAALWRRGRGWLVVLLLSPLPLNLAAAVLRKYPYGDSARVAQYVAPAVCLLAGAGLAAMLGLLLSRRRAAGVRVAAALLAVGVVAYMVADVAKPYKRKADVLARQAVRDLSGMVRPGDAVAFFGSFNVPGFDPAQADADGPDLRLYGGSAARLRYNLMRYGPWPIAWAPPPGELPIAGSGRTFLLVYHDSKTPFPAEWARRYLDAAAWQLGQPSRVIDRDLRDRGEHMEVYCFGEGCGESVGGDERPAAIRTGRRNEPSVE